MMWRYRLRTARYGAQQNGKKDNEYGFFLLETLVAVSLATIVLTAALYSSSHVISAYTERVYDEELTMDTEFIESILIYRLRHARLKAALSSLSVGKTSLNVFVKIIHPNGQAHILMHPKARSQAPF